MKFSVFEIFLLVVAAILILFLMLWVREEISRWWAGRHARKVIREHSNPGFSKR